MFHVIKSTRYDLDINKYCLSPGDALVVTLEHDPYRSTQPSDIVVGLDLKYDYAYFVYIVYNRIYVVVSRTHHQYDMLDSVTSNILSFNIFNE